MQCCLPTPLWVLTLATALVASGVSPAWGQVAFDVPGGCGTASEFFAEVRQLQRTEAVQITLSSIEIVEISPGLHRLRLSGPDGTREFSDAECRTLFRTAVVIAAAGAPGSARDPAPVTEVGVPAGAAAVVATAPATQAAEPPAPSAVAPPSPAATAPPPSPPAAAVAGAPVTPVAGAAPQLPTPPEASTTGVAASRVFVAWAGAGVALALAPDPAFVAELGADGGVPRWGGSAALRYLPPVESTTEGELGLRLRAAGGRLAGYHEPWPFLKTALGLSLYWLEAEGVGILRPNTDTVWLAAPEIEVTASARLSPSWAVALSLQGRLALNRPSFEVQPQTEVYQVPRWGAGAIFRIEWSEQ